MPTLDVKETSLKLGGNKLTALPRQVLACVSLKELSVPKNALEGGDAMDLRHMVALEKLYVMDNPKLRRLPALPPSLTILHAGNIGLESLDESIFELTHLRILSLAGNKLVSLPANMSCMKKVQELDLSNNLFWRVPLQLRDMVFLGSMESLFFQGNPLPGPLKRNIVLKHKILEYFDQTVVVYETFLVLFMSWTRLRKNPSPEVDLGCLPRDCLNVIAGFVASRNTYDEPSASKSTNAARPKIAEGRYGLLRGGI